MALLGERQRASRGLLIDERCGCLGIVGDVCFGGPLGVGSVGGELQQFGIGSLYKGTGLVDGRGPLVVGALGKDEGRRTRNNKDCGKYTGTHGRKYITWRP